MLRQSKVMCLVFWDFGLDQRVSGRCQKNSEDLLGSVGWQSAGQIGGLQLEGVMNHAPTLGFV